MNTALSPDIRASLLQSKMTHEEEVRLVHGYVGTDSPWLPKGYTQAIRAALPSSAGYVPGITRLGIPALLETDASLGVANGRHMRPGDQATALPSSLSIAASWNSGLAYEGGAMIGQEARDKGFDVLLAGGIDLARDPRGGRTFEYSGEDPLLAGTMVGNAIRGIQDQHIISTIKHFAMNDQETGRGVMSANIDNASMRESDLLAFEIAIERGNPGSVMCAYNRVNETYSCENEYILNRVLKQDWGYKGFVMSDWGAVHSTIDAANNGLDQESAYNLDRADYFGDPLRMAILDGSVSGSRLDDMARRILYAMFANGLFDYPLVKQPINPDADLLVAQYAAEQGIVLLKNENKLLPLAAHSRSIAVIGGRADIGVFSGGGSSQVIPIGNNPSQEFLIGGAMQEIAGRPVQIPKDTIVLDPPAPLAMIGAGTRGTQVRYDDGADIASAVKLARNSHVAIVFAHQWMREGHDVRSLSLYGNQDALIAAVAAANPRTIVVLETGGPVLMPWLRKVGAVLEAWYPGNRGANAIADILFGKVNPSGRLPITFPQSESQLPRPVIPGTDGTQLLVAEGSRITPYDVDYTEGQNVGYKWFELKKLTPLFPFGFGLSYTTFSLTDLDAGGGVTINAGFDVSNTGRRDGMQTAQVYATPPGGVARLIGWSKVDLKPGQTRHVTVTADPRFLATFDTTGNVWRVAEGDYVVTLGSSSADVSATATVHITASTIKP
ncbi:MAG: glycoside hydrolase family 3 C-terminal domain-containing protein [Alphaproteobacteria bacterium]|nr:glycoside hydrolase family 3 C-terminal domain-containing protein [Alphaproteobacteria bacterium]MDE2493583.1 glycoside hydrolase family 3 C-terminal domain-containing protein [Alphaproteobacteria bacterium]